MNIKDIIGDIDKLTPEQQHAAIDALKAIQQARMGGGGSGGGSGGIPPESNLDVDPDLLVPPSFGGTSSQTPEIDDPDDLLKKQQHMGNQPPENQQQDPQKTDGDDNDNDNDNENEQDNKDFEFDPTKLDSRHTPPSTKSSGSDHQAPQTTTVRKNDIQRTLSLAQRALNKAKQAGAPTKEIEDAINKLKNLTDKEIDQLSGDEFGDMINSVLDAIGRVLPVQYSTDINARIKKIRDDLPAAAKEIGQEDQTNKRSEEIKKELEKQKIKAREEERERFASASLKPISRFYLDFSRAIEDQVEDLRDEVEEDSWSNISRRHDGSDGIIAPGTVNREVWGKDIPVIDIYMDCSGSWSPSDLQVGMRAVKSVQEFEDKGEIKINRFYFSDHVFPDYESAKAEGSTNAWPYILKNIIATKAKNVIILTDSDMDWLAQRLNESVTVDGHVWFLWKDGQAAPNLPYYLRGRNGTSQYTTR